MKIRAISSDLAKVARIELNETPERIESDVNHLKDWLEKQPHLPSIDDDQLLVTFLRGAKYSLERAKEKLDMYYTVRGLTPEFFSNRDPTRPALKHHILSGFTVPLSDYTREGRKIIFSRYNNKDVSLYDTDELLKLWILTLDVLMREDDTFIVNGVIGICDLECYTLGHLTKLSLLQMKKAFACFQDIYPIRIKQIHYINPPTMIDMFMKFTLPLCSEKLQKRVFVHAKGSNTLFDHVPKEAVPKDYGGQQENLDITIAKWYKKLEGYRDWIAEEDKLKTNEARRPGKPKTQGDIFGVEGSFRKLIID